MKYRIKFNTSVIVFIFVLFIQGISNISAQEKSYNTKPYNFVASEIMSNKIVMVGENGCLHHYNLFPYITLSNIIKCWNNEAKEENIHNRTLTLIMEKSPSAVKLIQQYIDNDDLNPFLDKHYDVYSLEDLYLFYKLRELGKEIRNNGNMFKIVGFEIDERYKDERFFTTTDEERRIFYGRDRDSLLYANMKAYIKSNPEKNIVLDYGNAHLDEEYGQMTEPTKTYDGKGYFLAHYLRKEFGEKFVTIDQSFIDENVAFNYGNDLAYLKDKNFLIKKEDTLFVGKIPFTQLKSDFIIIKHDGLVGPHFIRDIFSRNTLIRDYNKVSEFEILSKKYNQAFSLKQSEVNNALVSLTLQSIKLITGTEFPSVKDFKSYIDSTENYFYHDRILKEEFSNELLAGLQNNPNDRDYRYMLFSLGLSPWIYLNSNLNPTKEQWDNNYWKNVPSNMNYFDYVGLFWFGNSSEKLRAKKYLSDFTNKDFTEPAEYLEWYYKNKFNYNFEL
jgi:hypothetical protein